MNLSDKATEEETIAGVSDTKWITPKGLKTASDSILKPGDIIYKTNKMSKDGFLKCDGSAISLDKYPRLESVLDKIGITVSSEAITNSIGYIYGYPIASVDGYGIAQYSDNTGVYILIIDPISKNITKQLLASKASTNNYVSNLYFFGKVNNQYVALLDNDNTHHYIAVSSSLQSTYSVINWTWRISDSSSIQRIIYKDSQYMICTKGYYTYVSNSLSGGFSQYGYTMYPTWIYRGDYFYVVGNSGANIQIYKRATLDGSNIKTINLFTTGIPSSYAVYPGYPCDLFDLNDDYWYIFFYSASSTTSNAGNIWVFDNEGNVVSKLAFTTANNATINQYSNFNIRFLDAADNGTYFFTNPSIGNYITNKQTFSSLDDFTKISESVLPIFSKGAPRITHGQDKYIMLDCINSNQDKWYLLNALQNAAVLPNMPAIDIASPYIKF